jgi:cytochrome c oxidase subunit II
MKHFVIIAVLVVACTLLLHMGLTDIGLLPKEASTQAVEIDKLFNIHLWLMSALFSLIIITLLYSLILFRRKKGEVGDGAYIVGNNRLEVLWTMIPFFVVIYLAFLGAQSLGAIRTVDTTALVVRVTAGQWFWKFQYQDTGIASSTLYLPVGRQVDLQMTSLDVIHSFWVPEFRTKQDLVPGQTTELRITPDLIGIYHVRCAELCGTRHAYMEAPVYVVSQQDFDKWVVQQVASLPTDPVSLGGLLVQQNGCLNCHSVSGSAGIGPTWQHLYQSKVTLSDGSTVTADADYLRNSIMTPNLQVVKGFYPNVMPNFSTVLKQADVENIIAYIQSLK